MTTSITLHVDTDKLIALAIVAVAVGGATWVWSAMHASKRPWVKETSEWILFAYILGFLGKAWSDCVSATLTNSLFEAFFVTTVFAWAGVLVVALTMPKKRLDALRAWAGVRAKAERAI